MNKYLLATSVVALITTGAHAVEPQASDRPAGAPADPAEKSIEKDILELKALLAQQTLRLDEAEQALKSQAQQIEVQKARIAYLEQQAPLAGKAAQANGSIVVRKGDTLVRVARRSGVDVAALARANRLKAPYRLRAGQVLKAPAPPPLAMAQTAPPEPAVKVASVKAAAAEAQVQPQTSPTVAPPPARRLASATQGDAPPSPGERPDVVDRALQEQRRREPSAAGSLPTEVGARPADDGQRPNVAVLPDVGGILTPRGAFFLEPSFDYSVTDDNRFAFNGPVFFNAVLVGSIDATQSDRRSKTASLGARYGVTNRLEIDGRVSFVDRKDQVRGVRLNNGNNTFSEFTGSGIGDAEIGLHYQLNRGRKFPYTVANLRMKAPTGDGPFDLKRDSNGVETELATGSGYWTVEPSFTFILPSDPAVIFANVGYQVNLKSRPDILIGTDRYLEFDPGEAVRASLGMGLSVNEKMSVSFGYDHTSFYKSKTLVERQVGGQPTLFSFSQAPAVVGSFLFGGSYTVNNRLRINFNTAIGATEDAPDVRASIRAQFRLFD